MLRAKAGKTAGVGFVGWMSLALLVPLGDSFADAPPATVGTMPSLDGAGYFWQRGRQVWPTPSVLATLNQNLFIKLPKGTSSSSLDALLERHQLRFLRRLQVDGWIYVQSTQSPVAVARALVERGEVLDAEPSAFVQPELHGLSPSTPSDPYFDEQWPLAKVVMPRTLQGKGSLRGTDHAHVAEAWALLQSLHGAPPVASLGNQVRVAIIDDGFDLQHEDLKDKFVASANFGGPLPPGTLFRGESPRDFHGTLVTGIAAASTDNGKGMAGACPGCRLVAARMASHPEDGLREDQYYDHIFAWVMAQNPDVINCSWGPGASVASSYFEDLVDQITTQGRQGKGTILVVASGNAGASMEANPLASHPRSITVGASDSLGVRHGFSNFGLGLDLLAPTSGGIKNSGVSTTYVDPIWSTDNYVRPTCLASGRSPSSGCSDTAGWSPTSPMVGGDGWDGKYSFRFSHTSAAAPLVAGIVGLMLDANSQLSASDVQTILQETADPVSPNDAHYDGNGFSQTYGYGRINALRAVARAYEFQGLSLPTALADAVEQASPCLRPSCANPRAFGASSPSANSPGQNGASHPPTSTSPSAEEAKASGTASAPANAQAKPSEAAPISANAISDASADAKGRRDEQLTDDGQTSSLGAVACSTGGRPAPQSLRALQPYFFLALAWATFRFRRKGRPANTHARTTPRANYKLQ